jgi:hypothetical protein
MSTIVLNSLNYVGNGILNGISWFYERAAGVVSQFSALTNRINFGATKTTVAWKLVIPVVIPPDEGCCTVTKYDDTIVDVTLRFARDIPAANRTDTLERLQDLVLTSQFTGSVTNLAQAS